MVRLALQLHPWREPAPIWSAATVLLLRDGAQGLEVLMTRRSLKASFAPGAYVFPGGGIEDADRLPATHALADRRATQDDERLTQAIAAIRESFEELGVLLARHPADGATPGGAGRWVSQHDIATLDRHAPFAEQCAARGLRLAADGVFTYAHWITDRDLPRRFDVPFLVARVPPGQQPVADEKEQFAPEWVRPADALARHHAGQFFMIYPTIHTLDRLRIHATVDAVLAACAGEQPLWTSCPRSGLVGGERAIFMEHEAPYGEIALVNPDGQITHPLDWQHQAPVPLLRHVQRLTAPNPGMMTGPGTNSYIVGSADAGFIVIDPGPADDGHVQRLFDACHADGGRIQAIVCTHSHPDHAPGAAPLQALCEARAGRRPPVLGLPSAPTARSASHFVPDRVLQDQEQLTLTVQGLPVSLRAIHTPGHAANHLCLVLQEDGLLFSGDHILNGSTTVIDPPDGEMTAYLESLDALSAACDAFDIQFILPAHGYVLGFAPQAIAQLKAHRLRREAKVIAAMRAKPGASDADLVPLAYDDTPRPLWPLAQRSLLAHRRRIEALGLA